MVELTEVKEGLARVLVPKSEWKRGPGTAKTPVFYNPTMELNRDVSVAVLKALHRKGMRVLDGLAASGIRGIRFALEVGDIELTMNDWNNRAQELMRRNAEMNGVDAEITGKNLNVLLNERKFDYIDIDPFGSPAEFLDSATRALRNRGILAITATDTAVLCGVYPKVCYRRYMAWPEHNWCMHEVGLRILIGHTIRMAARNDVGLEPLLSYSADHYFRLYLRAKKGAGSANRALENIGTVSFSGLSWEEKGNIGPLWMGELHDRDFLERMEVEGFFGSARRMEGMMEIWREESNMPPFYHELPVLSSIVRTSTPPISLFMEHLKGRGYRASRTHFSPTAVKTDASPEVLMEIIKEIGKI